MQLILSNIILIMINTTLVFIYRSSNVSILELFFILLIHIASSQLDLDFKFTEVNVNNKLL